MGQTTAAPVSTSTTPVSTSTTPVSTSTMPVLKSTSPVSTSTTPVSTSTTSGSTSANNSAPINTAKINVADNLLSENDFIGVWGGVDTQNAKVQYMLNYDDDNYIIFLLDMTDSMGRDSNLDLKMLLINKDDGTSSGSRFIKIYKFVNDTPDVQNTPNYRKRILDGEVSESDLASIYNDNDAISSIEGKKYQFIKNEEGWENFTSREQNGLPGTQQPGVATNAAATTTARPVTTTARPAPTTTGTPDNREDSEQDNTGMSLGIIIGIVVLIVAIIGVGIYVYLKRNNKKLSDLFRRKSNNVEIVNTKFMTLFE